MQKILIVSENRNISEALESGFSEAGWLSDIVGMEALIQGKHGLLESYHCLVQVIDRDFPRRFEGALEDMASLLRQCPVNSLYLMFEGDYLPCFSDWLAHTRRLFRKAMHLPNMQRAIEEIVWLESAGTAASGYISPSSE
jgi:hypothetical protein